MQATIKSISTYLNALSLRERILVTFVLCAVVYAIFNAALLSGFEQQYKRQLSEQQQIQQQQQDLDLAFIMATQKLVESKKSNLEKTQAIDDAKHQFQQTKIELDAVFTKLVPPTKITELLRSLLLPENSLTILSLNNEPVKTINFDTDQASPSNQHKADDHLLLYEHATTIKLTGGYQQLYQYLVMLEESDWELFWDELHYTVADYPNAAISIRVHTISTDEHWIGL